MACETQPRGAAGCVIGIGVNDLAAILTQHAHAAGGVRFLRVRRIRTRLPTYLSTSSVTTGQIWFSLGGFIAFYTALLVVELYLMLKYARLGPSSRRAGRASWRWRPAAASAASRRSAA